MEADIKNRTNYFRDYWRKNGTILRHRYKDRIKREQQRSYIRNRDRILKRNQKYYLKNKQQVIESVMHYQQNNPIKKAHWRKIYGDRYICRRFKITSEQLKALRSSGCGICRSLTLLRIDHDHSTGKLRGILCHKCNAALGVFGDNIDGLNKAISYLQNGFEAIISERL